uniref:Uncharacterized protein n=1 Tax=Nelumbo nucifera TaxID=4432 RepID=A0A823A354_NELNU|nr:TPA_asm: hypothetical protein HUJ06_018445 [Nelumbo nucifera]
MEERMVEWSLLCNSLAPMMSPNVDTAEKDAESSKQVWSCDTRSPMFQMGQENFYFNPGDARFKVIGTKFTKPGISKQEILSEKQH